MWDIKKFNWHASFKHNYIKVMIRWKIWLRYEWVSWQTKLLEETKNNIYIYI